jgi:hypothetical protein
MPECDREEAGVGSLGAWRASGACYWPDGPHLDGCRPYREVASWHRGTHNNSFVTSHSLDNYVYCRIPTSVATSAGSFC